ncbi:MAG: 6-bladed beta-propeller [Bdellovibrionales bacterium]|nr:6-bladed beta-propeller [Bdellovibrionales bacterium]
MGKRKTTTWIAAVAIPILFCGFQNCTQAYAPLDPSVGGLQASESGNGNAYDGKLVLEAPTVMTRGEDVELTVTGGRPPFNLVSNLDSGQFIEVSPGVYSFRVGSREQASSVVVTVYDSEGQSATSNIQIWGLNKWFFESPRSLAEYGTNEFLILEGKRPSLTLVTVSGEVKRRWGLEETAATDEAPLEFMAYNGSGVAVVSDESSKLFGYDLRTESILFTIDDSNGDYWNSCGGIQDISLSPSKQFAVLCEDGYFLFGPSGQLLSTVRFAGSNSRPANALAFEVTGEAVVARRGVRLEWYNSQGVLLRSQQATANSLNFQSENSAVIEMVLWGAEKVMLTTARSANAWGRTKIIDKETGHTREPVFDRADGSSLSGIWGVLPLSDGGFAVTEANGNNILRYDEDRNMIGRYGRKAVGDFYFRNPKDIEIRNGTVYVLDDGNSRFVKYSVAGEYLGEIRVQRGSGSDRSINDAEKFAVDDAGVIYAVNTRHHRIDVYNDEGFVRSLGARGSSGKDLYQPRDVIVADGLLHITEDGSDSLKTWTKSGRFVRKVRGWGTPQSAVFVEGKIVFQERFGDAGTTFYRKTGGVLQQFDRLEDLGLKAMKEPTEIIFCSKLKQFYIADPKNDRIVVFNVNGNFKKVIGKRGWGYGEFNRPDGIEVDEDGNLFIADTRNSRIQILPAYLLK